MLYFRVVDCKLILNGCLLSLISSCFGDTVATKVVFEYTVTSLIGWLVGCVLHPIDS